MRDRADKRKRLATTAAVGVLALVALPGAAFAAAPMATTGPTTVVGSTTATVTGTVDPGAQSTNWHVEYGTSTGYGTSTSAKSAGSGSSSVAISAGLTGLKVGTTYHYRVVATNGAGTSHGTDAVFTTTVPPDVTTGTASSITATAATLNGTVDPNGRDTTCASSTGHRRAGARGTPSSRRLAERPRSPESRDLRPAGRTQLRDRIVASSDTMPDRREGLHVHVERQRHSIATGERVVGDADDGDTSWSSDTERSFDHSLVRVRHVDALRIEDSVDKRRLGNDRELGVRGHQESPGGDDLSLPSCRAELERQGVRRRPQLLHSGPAVEVETGSARAIRLRPRGAGRCARSQRPHDDLVVRLRHVKRATANQRNKECRLGRRVRKKVGATLTGLGRAPPATIGSSCEGDHQGTTVGADGTFVRKE